MILKSPILAASLMDSSVEHTDENILSAMSKLRYPVLATTKYDGVRAIKWGGRLLSRTLKPIPNERVQYRAKILPEGFDTEIIIEGFEFNEVSGIVRSNDPLDDRWLTQSDNCIFYVLDIVSTLLKYGNRQQYILDTWNHPHCSFIYPTLCTNKQELFDFFRLNEHLGNEGICFRTPESPYKMGRSTLKEQYLVKLSRYLTSEAVIIGFIEQMENGNPDKRLATGMMRRSTDAANMYGKNTLGALVCKDVKSGVEFNCGTGFDDKTRKEIWNNRDCYIDKQFTYKYKPTGMLNKPRHPVFVGIRGDGL